MNKTNKSDTKTTRKYNKNLVNSLTIDTISLLDRKPSKAEIVNLKWKYTNTTARQSLPNQLDEELSYDKFENVCVHVRRKTESDLELDINNYNINTLDKEILEHKNKVKHDRSRSRKCKKLKHKHNESDYLKDTESISEDLKNHLATFGVHARAEILTDSQVTGLIRNLTERIKREIYVPISKKKFMDYFVSEKDVQHLRSLKKGALDEVSTNDFQKYIVSYTQISNYQKEIRSRTPRNNPENITGGISIDNACEILAFMKIYEIYDHKMPFNVCSYFKYVMLKLFRKLFRKKRLSTLETSLSTESKKISDSTLPDHFSIVPNENEFSDTKLDKINFPKKIHYKIKEYTQIYDEQFLDYFRQTESLNESLFEEINIDEKHCLRFFRIRKEKDENLLQFYHKMNKSNKKNVKLNTSISDIKIEKRKMKSQELPRKRRNIRNNSHSDTLFSSPVEKVEEIADEGRTLDEPKPKINAFAVMMHARNKIIGTNSPGKDASPEVEINAADKLEKKNILNKRKSIFAEWSDKKGASKRKKEDEEIEECIDIKMEKRAKRLKLLLENQPIKISSDTKKTSITKVNSSLSKNCDNTNKINDLNDQSPIVDRKSRSTLKDVTPINKKEVRKNVIKSKTKRSNIRDRSDSISSSELMPLHESKSSPLINGKKHKETFPGNSVTKTKPWTLRIRTRKVVSDDDVEVLLGSDDEYIFTPRKYQRSATKIAAKENMVKGKRDAKLAPVFCKKTSSNKIVKPMEDPEVTEARRNFLQSGVSAAGLKLIERQKACAEFYTIEIFPSISHVQQKPPESDPTYEMWNLKPTSISFLEYKEDDLFISHSSQFSLASLINSKVLERKSFKNSPTKQGRFNPKIILKQMKTHTPRFPVYAMYRQLRAKKRMSESKQNDKESTFLTNLDCSSICFFNKESHLKHSMWTQKYKPDNSSDIVGNAGCLSDLKDWLQNWCDSPDYRQIIIKSDKQTLSKSVSDFIIEDSSEDSLNSVGINNIIVLVGPSGSGKTSMVYAIANELGINVLEINASSHRSGKIILRDIHEATQSHQILKNTTTNRDRVNFRNSSIKSNIESEESNKLSLILVEDIDLVFSAVDDGFLTAVNSLINSSKRPVIITSSDKYSACTQKYMATYKTLTLKPVSTKLISPWVKIISILEGVNLNLEQIFQFVEFYSGDMRKVLLNLQFLIQGGAKYLRKISIPHDIDTTLDSSSNADELNVSLNRKVLNTEWILPCEHSMEFIETSHIDRAQIAFPIKLENIWLNLSSILNLPAIVVDHTTTKIDAIEERIVSNGRARQNDLNSLTDMFDCLAFTDLVHTRLNFETFRNPARSSWQSHYTRINCSLSLNENKETYNEAHESLKILSHSLVSNSLHLAQEALRVEKTKDTNWSHPNSDLKSSELTMSTIEDALLDGVSMSAYLGPSSLALDYFPALRAINRSETVRSSTNQKRQNRFYHFFKSIQISCTEKQLKIINETFNQM